MASSGDTHPVYIDVDRKTRVKTLAAQKEVSMKEVTERFAEHGDLLKLSELPVESSEEEVFNHVREIIDEHEE